jgi:hypothetical protein
MVLGGNVIADPVTGKLTLDISKVPLPWNNPKTDYMFNDAYSTDPTVISKGLGININDPRIAAEIEDNTRMTDARKAYLGSLSGTDTPASSTDWMKAYHTAMATLPAGATGAEIQAAINTGLAGTVVGGGKTFVNNEGVNVTTEAQPITTVGTRKVYKASDNRFYYADAKGAMIPYAYEDYRSGVSGKVSEMNPEMLKQYAMVDGTAAQDFRSQVLGGNTTLLAGIPASDPLYQIAATGAKDPVPWDEYKTGEWYKSPQGDLMRVIFAETKSGRSLVGFKSVYGNKWSIEFVDGKVTQHTIS